MNPSLFFFIIRPLGITFNMPENCQIIPGYVETDAFEIVKQRMDNDPQWAGLSAKYAGVMNMEQMHKIMEPYVIQRNINLTILPETPPVEEIKKIEPSDLFGKPAIYLLQQLIERGKILEEEKPIFESVINRLTQSYEVSQTSSEVGSGQ